MSLILEGIIEDSIRLKTRKKDTDIYRHINNSNYHPYFEKARVSVLKKANLYDKELIEKGLGLFVRESKERYQNPMKANQEIRIDSKIEIYKSRVIVKSKIYNSGREKATSEKQHCFVNLKNGKPARIPEDILKNMLNIALPAH